MVSKNNIPIRKSWGQNFLIDNNTVDKIIKIIAPKSSDTILEIGPGHGALTKKLLSISKSLHAVEVDPMLCKLLIEKYPTMHLYNQDILKFEYSQIFNKIVGNIPYNISSQIIFKFLSIDSWDTMTLMLQKELAKRIVSGSGSKEYGRISVMVQNLCKVTYKCDISKNVFQPKPKVDSGILQFENLKNNINIEKFSAFIKQSFMQRRKKLKNNLKHIYGIESLKSYADKRPEEISPKEYLNLFNKIYF